MFRLRVAPACRSLGRLALQAWLVGFASLACWLCKPGLLRWHVCPPPGKTAQTPGPLYKPHLMTRTPDGQGVDEHPEFVDAQSRQQEHDPEKWMPVFGKDHAPPIM